MAAIFLRSDEPVVCEPPQMVRCVRHSLSDCGSHVFNGSWGLGKQVEDLETAPAGQRGRHSRKRIKHRVLGGAGSDGRHHTQHSSTRLTIAQIEIIFK
jgi:hypothetical protein